MQILLIHIKFKNINIYHDSHVSKKYVFNK